MRRTSLSGLIDIGLDILTTSVASTGRIIAQVGDVVSGAVYYNSVEWWQHVGYASRPPKPVAGKKAAQAVLLKTSDRDVIVASVDQRGLDLYVGLDFGESCMYAAGEDGNAQGRIFIKKDGSIHLYTRKGNTPDGAGMTIQVDPTNGAIRLLNDQGYGLIVDADGITLTSGNASLVLGADGKIELIGKGTCQIDGSGICLGSNAVPGVNSALTGATGLVGVASTKVLIATA